MEKTLFCKVTWMQKYEGEEAPESRHRNVEEYGYGCEEFLFKAIGTPRMNYGYVHVSRLKRGDKSSKQLRIERLGAPKTAKKVDHVHVIWVASPVSGEGTCVVGDYRDATVYREPIEGDDRFYNVVARSENCTRIPERKRLPLSGFPLRMGNVWYAGGALGEKLTRNAVKALRRFYKARK